MLVAAALSLSLLGHAPHWPHQAESGAAAARRPLYKLGPWFIAVHRDTFTGAVACQLHTSNVNLQHDALVFRVAPQGDTTAAVYRVDLGPPHRVAEVFDAVEARGFFPQRGWIVDPNGGEAVLPAASVAGARAVWIRVSSNRYPHRFDVARLAEARAAARGLGCSV